MSFFPPFPPVRMEKPEWPSHDCTVVGGLKHSYFFVSGQLCLPENAFGPIIPVSDLFCEPNRQPSRWNTDAYGPRPKRRRRQRSDFTRKARRKLRGRQRRQGWFPRQKGTKWTPFLGYTPPPTPSSNPPFSHATRVEPAFIFGTADFVAFSFLFLCVCRPTLTGVRLPTSGEVNFVPQLFQKLRGGGWFHPPHICPPPYMAP